MQKRMAELYWKKGIAAVENSTEVEGIEGIDMYASMTPAKEVGGDLYSYLLLDDKLYFCIGDVSGKGVPASLFMAIVTRGFRTLALAGKTPAEIATRLNYELTEDNEEGMFVTMFICRLVLKLRRLEYCNAGHNPLPRRRRTQRRPHLARFQFYNLIVAKTVA